MKTATTKERRARRARKFDRSFQPSAAGKGDADRTADVEAYRRNFDLICWSSQKKPTAARRLRCDCNIYEYCEICSPEEFRHGPPLSRY